MSSDKLVDISIVIPFYNEEENVEANYAELSDVMRSLNRSYELIYIDDGSRDIGHDLLSDLAQKDPSLKVIRFTRNFGQTAAMAAGFKEAKGATIVTLDADNQNDPHDIPKLLEKMREGFGVVSGWRRDRKDRFINRRLPSKLANALISKVTGVHLNDYGCTLKAYEARYIKLFNLYGEMHRFIPAYAHLAGATISEVPVNHRPRTKGVSKYGLSRIFKVILDLLTVKFLGSFSTKPLYFFGGAGLMLNFIALIAAGLVIYQKFMDGVFAHRNPLLLLAVFLSVVGLMFIMIGLMAEMLMRTYHESQGKNIYVIRDRINCP